MKFSCIKYLLLLQLGSVLVSCYTKVAPDKGDKKFKKPVVINSKLDTTKTTAFFPAESVLESHPVFYGKFKFKDTLDLAAVWRDTISEKDIFYEYPLWKIPDSLDTNGFDLIIDYKTDIYCRTSREDSLLYNYYPIYLVNSTNSTKLFLGKDSHGFGIQEAEDKSNYNTWTPIEGRRFDHCGNGTWGLIVRPKEFVLLLMKKYNGNLNLTRVRIANDESIYVSRPFFSKIDSQQFVLPKNSWIKNKLVESKGRNAGYWFYGALPKKAWLLE